MLFRELLKNIKVEKNGELVDISLSNDIIKDAEEIIETTRVNIILDAAREKEDVHSEDFKNWLELFINKFTLELINSIVLDTN